MSSVKICPKCGSIAEWDSYFGGTRCTRCDFVERSKPSNADRIRAMTDEELAEWLDHRVVANSVECPPQHGHKHCLEQDGCRACWLDWLRQEAE